jgi:hypothetical protein
MEWFNLKNLKEVEGKERYLVEVPIRFSAWKISVRRWKLIALGKRLEKI